jgi:hypothetical protein
MKKALVFKDYAKTDFDYEGVLHGFGIEYEELRDGIGQYTVVIIERENGDLTLEPIKCVRLLEAHDGI